MRFGDYQTLHKYDKFKEQFFGNKKDSFKANYRTKNQNKKSTSTAFRSISQIIRHSFFKRSVVLVSLGVIVYQLNSKQYFQKTYKYLKDQNIQFFNPLIQHSFFALKNDFMRRITSKQIDREKQGVFATSQLIRRISEDQNFIECKNNNRLLKKDIKSQLALGAFKFGVNLEQVGINSDGYLIKKEKRCKLQIGNVSFWGTKKVIVLKKEPISETYSQVRQKYGKQQKNILEKACQRANLLNSLAQKQQEYQQIIQQCNQQIQSRYFSLLKNVQNKSAKYKDKIFQTNNRGSIFLISL